MRTRLSSRYELYYISLDKNRYIMLAVKVPRAQYDSYDGQRQIPVTKC